MMHVVDYGMKARLENVKTCLAECGDDNSLKQKVAKVLFDENKDSMVSFFSSPRWDTDKWDVKKVAELFGQLFNNMSPSDILSNRSFISEKIEVLEASGYKVELSKESRSHIARASSPAGPSDLPHLDSVTPPYRSKASMSAFTDTWRSVLSAEPAKVGTQREFSIN